MKNKMRMIYQTKAEKKEHKMFLDKIKKNIARGKYSNIPGAKRVSVEELCAMSEQELNQYQRK